MGSSVSLVLPGQQRKMDFPVVSTPSGKAKGFALPKAKCDEAKQVFAFMGLPFAKPPTGELRFEPPQKMGAWKGVRDCTKSPPIPIQDSYYGEKLYPYQPYAMIGDESFSNMSEDCLYLNVYTNNPSKTANMPVLVWIYGGWYSIGSVIGYHGQAICGMNDVVLVVPQYRVNVFGFYSAGKNTKWPGNMGLLDQVLALKWIRENIASFGGNPNNVTIFGQSAGFISVSMHVTSPMSRGLFHRAISHSGVGSVPSTMKPDLSMERNAFLKELKITDTDPEHIMKKLKALDASKLVEALQPEKTLFVPTVDGKFNPKHTKVLLEEGNFNSCPYIFGVTNSEGCGVLSSMFPPGFNEGLSQEIGHQVVTGMVATVVPPENVEAVSKEVLDFYSKEIEEDKYKWSKILGNILADGNFCCATIAQAMIHSMAGNNTYLYYMTQPMHMHHDETFSSEVGKKPSFCEADHCDDIMMTFGYPFMDCKMTMQCRYSEDETNLSRRWMDSICQFARTGNPNTTLKEEWPKYDPQTKKHLILKIPYEVGSNLLENRCKLWLETVPAMLK